MSPKQKLSHVEVEILQYVAEGKTSRDVALIRGRACRTVMKQCENLRDKLGASTLAHAVAIAMRDGIIK